MQPSNDRGFTLIEVLIAMVVLTVAMVSMAQLMAVTLRLQQLGRNQTAAVRQAQDKIDELMSQNFATNAQLAVGGSLTADVANHFDSPVDSVNGQDRQYRRRWLVENMNFGDTGLQLVGGVPTAVAAGQTRRITVRVTPLVANRGISPPVDLVTLVRCWPCP